jgi:hypothetical protein
VLDGLPPSAIFRALGKEALCRVPKKHSIKKALSSARDKALGKVLFADQNFVV